MDGESVPLISACVNSTKSQVTGMLRFIGASLSSSSMLLTVNQSINKRTKKKVKLSSKMQFTCTNHKEKRPHSFTHENHPPKKGNHDIRRETRRAVCCSRYRLSAERFFTLTCHYCSSKRLILKPLNFGGRWQNCQFPHGGKSQLASPHLLSAGRKSYYFVYIKI